MKRILTSIAAGALLTALAVAQTPRYSVNDLGTLGGSSSVAFGINPAGRVAGAANIPGEDQRAFITGIGNMLIDLGGLGGPNSLAGAPNGMGELPVVAEMPKPDPLGEDFCGYGTHLICLGALWNGTMMPLPNLGGNNGETYSMNNQGQIVGVAENSVHDSTCAPPQVLDFLPVAWGPNPAQVQALPLLPGDTVGAALWNNDLGQVVGSTGTCANTTFVGLPDGPHAVLWDNGAPIDLGNLGGKMHTTASAINNRTEVVGGSNLPGESIFHGFLWTKAAGLQDIGLLGMDIAGIPTSINNNTQVVGASCDSSGNCRGFLWQNNVMTDLNTLIPANSPLYIVFALGINDAGEIAGQAVEKSTGNLVGFVLTPLHSAAAGKGSAPETEAKMAEVPRPALPRNARELLLRRYGIRLK
jgi:probable HAF family extracellular repeat protein